MHLPFDADAYNVTNMLSITGGVSRIQLTLDIQLDESMTQEWTSVGLKVKVHDPQEHPLFTESSITIPPGVDATILVERRKVTFTFPNTLYHFVCSKCQCRHCTLVLQNLII